MNQFRLCRKLCRGSANTLGMKSVGGNSLRWQLPLCPTTVFRRIPRGFSPLLSPEVSARHLWRCCQAALAGGPGIRQQYGVAHHNISTAQPYAATGVGLGGRRRCSPSRVARKPSTPRCSAPPGTWVISRPRCSAPLVTSPAIHHRSDAEEGAAPGDAAISSASWPDPPAQSGVRRSGGSGPCTFACCAGPGLPASGA